jgi:magnesium-protoporphyrin O-methyltransferase
MDASIHRGRADPQTVPAGTYAATRDRLETYFDRTAAETWARLTSDAPVSRIRATVRAGRAEMRAELLSQLPDDLSGMRVLDAGCGPGDVCVALARRGAEVVGVDLSASLLDVARERMPRDVADRIDLRAGDMTDPVHGRFDAVIAMDSLIHYRTPDLAAALGRLKARAGPIHFTVPPKTPLLTLMHLAGKAFPRADRSPMIVPQSESVLRAALPGGTLTGGRTVASGFYISRAMELS